MNDAEQKTEQAQTAVQLQAQRVAADLANHRERLEWLSSANPRWSCGAFVDSHMRNVLFLQSRAALGNAA